MYLKILLKFLITLEDTKNRVWFAYHFCGIYIVLLHTTFYRKKKKFLKKYLSHDYGADEEFLKKKFINILYFLNLVHISNDVNKIKRVRKHFNNAGMN